MTSRKPKRCHLPPRQCPAKWICRQCGVKCCEHRCGFKKVSRGNYIAMCTACQRAKPAEPVSSATLTNPPPDPFKPERIVMGRLRPPAPTTLLKRNGGRPSYAVLAVWPPAEGQKEPTIVLLEGVLHADDLGSLVGEPRRLDAARKWQEAHVEANGTPSKKNEVARRWEEGVEHDPRSVKLAKALADIDYEQGGDYFNFKFGGDGDSGEELCFLLDIFFAQGGRIP